jgi:hypothetical protein
VDVARYEANDADAEDMSCQIKPVTDKAGGMVLDSRTCESSRVC